MIARCTHWLKRLVFATAGSDAALRARVGWITGAGALTILNLHRVDDAAGSAYSALKPALFDELVDWLKKRFRIVTFEDLEALEPGRKPPLILSFDDGYKDFIEIVAPILRKHGVRANQNVIPGCAERGKPPMNVALQDFIGMAPAPLLREIRLPGLPGGADPNDRVRCGIRASAVLKNRPIREQIAIFEDLERQFARFDGFRTTPLMTVADIREIAAEHEIGAHSWEHASMSAESNDYLLEDARRCLGWFREVLGTKPSIYAFPNGSFRPGQPEIVRSTGFLSVLTVGGNFSLPQSWVHPRFTIYGSSLNETRFRAVGAFRPAAPSGVLSIQRRTRTRQ